ncbi:acyltransferase [Psychromonas ossibalaenae]|uniref:acyltransferase n=1 Tax=Psychromonas ossibalaenae TaxID=444922 RepID=UPI000374881B|nr:hypothetical protein [Psychromonas ossibalaenae]
MKEILKGLVFYFINHILNKIPSRTIRMRFYYYLSNGRISLEASIGLGVRILDIRNITVGKNSNINFDSILDGRGAPIIIGDNVDIAPQVNIWSLEHHPESESHELRKNGVVIGDYTWIANRVTILPGTNIGKNHVVGAGGVMKGHYSENSISMGNKAKIKKLKNVLRKKNLRRLRVFR